MEKVLLCASYFFVLFSSSYALCHIRDIKETEYLQACLFCIFLNGLLSAFDHFRREDVEGGCSMRKVFRVIVPYLFTTHLFLETRSFNGSNECLNRFPLVIAALQLMLNANQDEVQRCCNNCSSAALNFLTQFVIAIQLNSVHLALEAMVLLMGHFCHFTMSNLLGLTRDAQNNYIQGSFCLLITQSYIKH